MREKGSCKPNAGLVPVRGGRGEDRGDPRLQMRERNKRQNDRDLFYAVEDWRRRPFPSQMRFEMPDGPLSLRDAVLVEKASFYASHEDGEWRPD